MNSYELRLPGCPKSLNVVGSRGSRFAFHREKKLWEGMCMIALNEAKAPKGMARVEATAVIHPPTAHKRDEGNFRMMLEKALGDALQLGGYLSDDSSEFFSFGRLSFGEKRKPAETIITLEVEMTA